MKAKTMECYAEFELDLIDTLKQQLPPVFDKLKAERLNRKAVDAIPQTQGVYMLLESGKPMYIGKTDSSHGFQDRLRRHLYTLSARKKIALSKVTFKAVRVMVFTTVNVESILIEEHLGKTAWQKSGFGSNDPGRQRETQAPSKFDREHPINIHFKTSFITPGNHNVRDLLVRLKEGLPYDFRYQTDKKANGKYEKYTVGHNDQRNTTVNVPQTNMTVWNLLKAIVTQLPPGWTATAFHGRVILYKETVTYQHKVKQFP